MVAHRVVISGGAGNQTQTIKGNITMHCEYAVLTQVVVQLAQKAGSMTLKSGMKTPVSDAAIPTTGSYGVSIRFPQSVVPTSATMHSGSEDERNTNHRCDVHFDSEARTLIYKPNTIMQDITFLSEYQVELFHIEAPHEALTDVTMADIASITLNFTLAVDTLMPA